MMRVALPTLAVLSIAGCASPPPTVPVPYSRYGVDAPPITLVETRGTPVIVGDADDIPESDRRAWFDAQRPAAPEVSEPQVVERVVVRDRPVYSDEHSQCPWWWLPISLSFGYSSGGGHGHGHGGWGWGISSYWPWCH